MRTRGIVVNIGLPTKPIQFEQFDAVFQEKTIKDSLVASIAQVKEMLKIVDRFGIRSRIKTVSVDPTPELPDRYMDPHLKGLPLMKLFSQA